MQIELFFEPEWTPNMGFIHKISAFRHSWNPTTKNQPILANVFNINKSDFMELVKVLDHCVILGNAKDYDYNTGNLYLKVLDYAKGNIYQGEFINSLYNI